MHEKVPDTLIAFDATSPASPEEFARLDTMWARQIQRTLLRLGEALGGREAREARIHFGTTDLVCLPATGGRPEVKATRVARGEAVGA